MGDSPTETELAGLLTGLFRLARYRFAFECAAEVRLPTYPGSTWRGALAGAFRRLVCVARKRECGGCALARGCPYALVFEPEALRRDGRSRDLPRPYVVEPFPGDQRPLQYELVLVGRAAEYLPELVMANLELGRRGVGAGRHQIALRSVIYAEEGAAEVVWDAASGTLRPARVEAWRPPSPPGDLGALTLEFLTPTSIKAGGGFTSPADFPALARGLIRRASLLAAHYGERPLPDLRELAEQAERVQAVCHELRWVDWQRYSNRQRAKVTLGGFVGEVRYRGELRPFWPLLCLGEVIHVGHGCVFGMGRYRIKG